MRWTLHSLAAFLALVSVSPAAFAATYKYTIIKNSANPNDELGIHSLNDEDVVVGEDVTAQTGFVWANGIGQAVSGATSFFSINDNGIAAGVLNNADQAPSLAIYDVASGTTQYYSFPITVNSVVNVSINSSNEIAGTLVSGKRDTTAFVLMPNGDFLTLAPPHEMNCSVSGLNDSGTVVGHCNKKAFIYSNGSFQTLKVSKFTELNPTFITAGGVVGGTTGLERVAYGFIYESGKVKTFLPSDLPEFDGLYEIIGALPDGDILGNYFANYGANQYGFIYDVKTKKSYQLGAPKAQITNYTAVNANGDIIGGSDASHNFIAICKIGATCLK